MCDILIGCRVICNNVNEDREITGKKEGTIVECDAQTNSSYFWVLFDDGKFTHYNIRNCQLVTGDVQKIRKVNKKILEKISKEQLLDFD